MDVWLASAENKGKFQIKIAPSNYIAYLEEHNILDDVKDVLEAYDLQVADAAKELTEEVIYAFEDIINDAKTKLRDIYYVIDDFNDALVTLESKMNKTVTSIRYENSVMVGYNEFESKKVERNHGTLSSFFPAGISTEIINAKKNIIPLLEGFEEATDKLNSYSSELYELKSYFNSIVEKAVYSSQDLNAIISSQKLIWAKIEVIKIEIQNVSSIINVEYKGKSIESYKGNLFDLIKSLNYFNSMINDCFDGNI